MNSQNILKILLDRTQNMGISSYKCQQLAAALDDKGYLVEDMRIIELKLARDWASTGTFFMTYKHVGMLQQTGEFQHNFADKSFFRVN